MPWPALKIYRTCDDFDTYCRELKVNLPGDPAHWSPQFVVLHNTGVPKLSDKPHGFNAASMDALQDYYQHTQVWSGGPHLFVDQNGVWSFNDPRYPGVHSPSWNHLAFGVEMLGDYDTESFTAGDGLAVHNNAVRAVAALSFAFGLDTGTMKLHREDPLTDHHCPGDNVDKGAFILECHAAKLKLLGTDTST